MVLRKENRVIVWDFVLIFMVDFFAVFALCRKMHYLCKLIFLAKASELDGFASN
jgi:hypothetical protein